jgi:hypothetical protein
LVSLLWKRSFNTWKFYGCAWVAMGTLCGICFDLDQYFLVICCHMGLSVAQRVHLFHWTSRMICVRLSNNLYFKDRSSCFLYIYDFFSLMVQIFMDALLPYSSHWLHHLDKFYFEAYVLTKNVEYNKTVH